MAEEKTEEEQAKLAAKRKEQGRRLQEQAAKARLEKVFKALITHAHKQADETDSPLPSISLRC